MKIQKQLLSLSIVAMFVTATPVMAAVGSAGFNVTATLSSVCTVGAIADLAFGAVAAFTAPPNVTTTAAITCTRGITPSVTAVFDVAAGTKGSSAAAAAPTGDGLLSNGLQYTLSTVKGAVTAGTAATNASIGLPDTLTYTITGAMVAQPGTCAAATCAGTQARTITLNF